LVGLLLVACPALVWWRLAWPMPRWTMSDEDLDDLLEFLKTLD
jgi:hypothetical protein